MNGYDLKGTIVTDRLFQRSALTGMHTHEDAFVCVREQAVEGRAELSIMDAHDIALELMGLA